MHTSFVRSFSSLHSLSVHRLFTSGKLQSNASVVILNGDGCTGLSVAYSLAKKGLNNVIVLQRKQHDFGQNVVTPGLVSYYHNRPRFRRMNKASLQLYDEIENSTLNKCGTLRVARTDDRVQELQFHSSQWFEPSENDTFSLLDADQLRTNFPSLDLADAKAAIYSRGDGFVSESDLRRSLLVECERLPNIQLVDDCEFMSITQRTADGSWDVVTSQGSVNALKLVNTAGLWSKDLAALSGIQLAAVPIGHVYAVAESGSTSSDLGVVLHDLDGAYTVRKLNNGILYSTPFAHKDVIIFEDWFKSGMPEDASALTATDAQQSKMIEAVQASSAHLPLLRDIDGWQVLIQPWLCAPDGFPLIGPMTGFENYFVATGFMNEVEAAGGAAQYLADFIVDGEPPFEAAFVEPNRFANWAFRSRRFIQEKAAETYSLQFDNVIKPAPSMAGRPTVRVSGLYGALMQQKAKMDFRVGWEQCSYFKTSDSRESYREIIDREAQFVLNTSGLIDLSLYGKIEIRGPDSEAFLNYVFASEIPSVGQNDIVFALTPKGKLLTRLRLIHHTAHTGQNSFLCMLRPEQEQRDYRWLLQVSKEKGFNIHMNNVTEYLGCVGLMGPLCRKILQGLTRENMSEESFPYGTARLIRVCGVPGIACCDTTAGEQGFQLYHARADSLKVYGAIMDYGRSFGVGNFGRHAFNALRIEKGNKFFGHELTFDYNPFEAQLENCMSLDKDDYIGKSAIQTLKKMVPDKRLHLLRSSDDVDVNGDPSPDLYTDGLEVVSQNGKTVGHTTSACWGPSTRQSLAFAYLSSESDISQPYNLHTCGKEIKAHVLEKPPALPYHLR